MMTAEGQSFAINQVVDTSGLGGAISGTVQWGDGTSSVASISAGPVAGPLKVRFDYSLDSNAFFASQTRRNALQSIADGFVSKFSDTLSAIQPTATDHWVASVTNPSTGGNSSFNDLVIAANEIVIYVGARTLGGDVRGTAVTGGFNVTAQRQSFVTAVQTRGQPGAITSPAIDFGPWGGSIAFDSPTDWYFGSSVAGIGPNQIDFTSVAEHELLHVLGFGTSNSWNAKVAPSGFIGANSTASYGSSPVPLDTVQHWGPNVTSNGVAAIMTSSVDPGVRKQATRLDLAALQDIGWQLITPQATVSASHIYGDNGTFATQILLSGAAFGSNRIASSATITNVPPTLLARINGDAVAGQLVSLSPLGQFTDPGFGAPQATPPQSETFVYSVIWGDGTPTQSGNATVGSLGNGTTLTSGFFNGSHTYATAGQYSVTLTVTDDDGGSAQQQFTMNVSPAPKLSATIDKNSIPENGGSGAAQLTIQRTGVSTSTATTLRLSSNDTTELTVPATVVIPIGQSSVVVPVTAIDDTLLDGTQRVVVTIAADGFTSTDINVDVLDYEQILVTLDRLSIAENSGAGGAVLTVARSNTDVGQSLTVALSSSDAGSATLPASVVIPAGASVVQVGVTAIDNAIVDGTRSVRFTGSSAGYVSGTVDLQVTDYEPLVLVLASLQLHEEDAATRTTQAEISIPGPAPTGGITLQLSPSLNGQLVMPGTITIPAGQTKVTFPISAIDDFLPEGRQAISITATGIGYVGTQVNLEIFDTDQPLWTNPILPFDVDNDGGLSPLDVLVLINEINRNGSRALDPINDVRPPYFDPNRDGFLSPLDVLFVINEINRRG